MIGNTFKTSRNTISPYRDGGGSGHGRLLKLTAIVSALSLLLLLLGACGGASASAPSGDAIAFEELPEGMGRGYPNVSLADINNTGTGSESGDQAPDFILQTEDGAYISLDDLKGRPVMLNFWATWCPPCRQEMPDIIKAYETDDELVVLAVNVREEIGAVKPFAEDFQISMPVVMDTDAKLSELYGVRGMPTSVFIDREGAIVAKWPGLLSEDALTAMLASIP